MTEDGGADQLTLSAWEYGEREYQYDSDSRTGHFVVEIKDSALKANAAVEAAAEKFGKFLNYSSEREAELHAQQLTEQGEARVVIQGIAPQDDTDADAYLIPQPKRHIKSPIDSEARTLEFHTGANHVGAIGETLITTPWASPAALTHFIKQDLDYTGDPPLRVKLAYEPAHSEYVDDTGRIRTKIWQPDCIAKARRGYTDEIIAEYWCEIKTGNASFERNQVEVMKEVASEPHVSALKIRVEIDDLPDKYGVRFNKVDSA